MRKRTHSDQLVIGNTSTNARASKLVWLIMEKIQRQVPKINNFADPFYIISVTVCKTAAVTTMKMKTMSLFVMIIGLVVWPMLATDAGKAPSPVFVNKCCRIGETLDRNQECSIGSTGNQWWPVIYLLQKNSYFIPHGEWMNLKNLVYLKHIRQIPSERTCNLLFIARMNECNVSWMKKKNSMFCVDLFLKNLFLRAFSIGFPSSPF